MQAAMRRVPNQLISVFLALITGAALGYILAFLSDFTWSEKARLENQRSLIKMFEELTVAEPDTVAARKLITAIRKERVYVDERGDVSTWYVSAPQELSQGHWVLVACMKNQKLTGARFGVADSVAVIPANAPKQKGVCDIAK